MPEGESIGVSNSPDRSRTGVSRLEKPESLPLDHGAKVRILGRGPSAAVRKRISAHSAHHSSHVDTYQGLVGNYKPVERARARALRREGVPLKRIAKQLDAAVSTVHLWTKDIRLTPEQQERNLTGPKGPHNREWVRKRAAAWSAKKRAERQRWQDEGRAMARTGEPLHIAGCMLYWAEGSKGRNSVQLSNSDAGMVRFFVRFLRESLEVTDDRLRFSLNVYTNNGLSIAEIEWHCLKLLELTQSSLRKHQLNHYPTSSSGSRRTLPHGVCSLSVARSTHEVQHIYGAIQEYSGTDQPKWLDGPPRKPSAPKAAA